MNRKGKVLVGMSGGVDSSVAAFLLKEEDYEVIGTAMSIWDGEFYSSGKHACYGPDEKGEIEDAKKICELLNIPFYVFDCSKEFKKIVLKYFKNEYISGRTPNPCIKCNQMLKFGILPGVARSSGLEFDKYATGHYANIEFDIKGNKYLLKKGIDTKKDQSYFLYRLSQDQLSSIIFPLGNYVKENVKKIAKDIKLPVNYKDESQDFFSGDYTELLNIKSTSGNIIDKNGKVLGKHNGIWNYTLGQRKGLGIAYKEPLYVIELNKKQNTVVAGTKDAVFNSSFIVDDINWIAIDNIQEAMNLKVKVRSTQEESEAIIVPFGEESVKVTYREPMEAISPGQSAVFYDKDIVIGGGIIKQIYYH